MEWAAIIRDLIIGLIVAGAIAAWVPDRFWRLFFFAGHPLAAKLWGPLIGPVLAIVSWLNIVLLALAAAVIVRFVRTGGVAMLRMMGGPPDTHEHDHSDSHASHGD
jgi:uncharacterized protein